MAERTKVETLKSGERTAIIISFELDETSLPESEAQMVRYFLRNYGLDFNSDCIKLIFGSAESWLRSFAVDLKALAPSITYNLTATKLVVGEQIYSNKEDR